LKPYQLSAKLTTSYHFLGRSEDNVPTAESQYNKVSAENTIFAFVDSIDGGGID
jgi:hypothetical protein